VGSDGRPHPSTAYRFQRSVRDSHSPNTQPSAHAVRRLDAKPVTAEFARMFEAGHSSRVPPHIPEVGETPHGLALVAATKVVSLSGWSSSCAHLYSYTTYTPMSIVRICLHNHVCREPEASEWMDGWIDTRVRPQFFSSFSSPYKSIKASASMCRHPTVTVFAE